MTKPPPPPPPLLTVGHFPPFTKLHSAKANDECPPPIAVATAAFAAAVAISSSSSSCSDPNDNDFPLLSLSYFSSLPLGKTRDFSPFFWFGKPTEREEKYRIMFAILKAFFDRVTKKKEENLTGFFFGGPTF